jgi:hypothetical protein
MNEWAALSSFMTAQVTDAHAHVQMMVSVVKLATVLEECHTEEHRSVMRYCTSVSMLVKDMSRNKCFFPGSKITCFAFYTRLWLIYWRERAFYSCRMRDQVSHPYNILVTGRIRLLCNFQLHIFDRRLEDKTLRTEARETFPGRNLTFSNNSILKNFSGFQLPAQNFITDL